MTFPATSSAVLAKNDNQGIDLGVLSRTRRDGRWPRNSFSLRTTRYPLLSPMLLSHRELGGAGHPPLVLLHGMLGSSRNWQTAGKDLAAAYEVFALDLRNHGASAHADTMSYPEMMADVLEWIDSRGLGPVTLVGHSMGGKIAMLLACRHPERVAKLFVVDIAPKNYFWPAHRVNFAAMNALNLAELHSRAEAEMRLEGTVTSRGLRKFLATNLEQAADGRWRWQINLAALTTALPEMEKNPLGREDHFAGPTLFIAGAKSPYIEDGDHAEIRRYFPAARIQVIADAGHNPHMEKREEFVGAVLAAG